MESPAESQTNLPSMMMREFESREVYESSNTLLAGKTPETRSQSLAEQVREWMEGEKHQVFQVSAPAVSFFYSGDKVLKLTKLLVLYQSAEYIQAMMDQERRQAEQYAQAEFTPGNVQPETDDRGVPIPPELPGTYNRALDPSVTGDDPEPDTGGEHDPVTEPARDPAAIAAARRLQRRRGV